MAISIYHQYNDTYFPWWSKHNLYVETHLSLRADGFCYVRYATTRTYWDGDDCWRMMIFLGCKKGKCSSTTP